MHDQKRQNDNTLCGYFPQSMKVPVTDIATLNYLIIFIHKCGKI